jgi:hypothetical protein
MDNTALSFNGPWIGETMGYDSPAHIWEIEVTGHMLRIRTRWEGHAHQTDMPARPVTGESAFILGGDDGDDDEDVVKAVLIDPQHFVILDWDTNDTRGGTGPAYDVVFSRPGVAELSAQAAYKLFLTQLSR